MREKLDRKEYEYDRRREHRRDRRPERDFDRDQRREFDRERKRMHAEMRRSFDKDRRKMREDMMHEFRHHRKPKGNKHRKQITTMFTSKEELVSYVNEKGALGHHIDIYKIDEGLYKVVVLEKPTYDDIEVEIIVDEPDHEEEADFEKEVEIEEEVE